MTKPIRGRFAPSPSGRMHLGNLFSALLAWLDIRSLGGTLVLRVEDLDPDRCRESYALQLADDLRWLGLDWDEGFQAGGPHGPYCQSERTARYEAELRKLEEQDLVFPCWCTRAERLAAAAPHLGEQRFPGPCPCRSLTRAQRLERGEHRRPAWRAALPDAVLTCTDGHWGEQSQNLLREGGDPILRRSDGVFAYQLAVTADDGSMGITRVVRGRDLWDSTPRQLWLLDRMGYARPNYFHLPLLLAPDGRRLSKRDLDLDMGALRTRYTPEQLLGVLGFLAGLLPRPEPVACSELLTLFDWLKIPKQDISVCKSLLF